MKVNVVSWTLGLTAVDEVVEKVRTLGLDGVQYAGDHRDVCATELRTRAREAGLDIIAVDPFNAGPDNPDAATARDAIDYYLRVVDFAVELGRVPVTLQGLSLWTANCPDRETARRRLVECCRAVDAYAVERGVGTLYEVCNHYEVPLIHTAAQCLELMNEVGGKNMRLILDSFHMNIDEPDPLATLREHARRTAIYHISDSGRGGIGSGHIDFQAQFDALEAAGFEGRIAIEPVLSHLTPSTPPQTGADVQALDEEIRRSARVWREYSATALRLP